MKLVSVRVPDTETKTIEDMRRKGRKRKEKKKRTFMEIYYE